MVALDKGTALATFQTSGAIRVDSDRRLKPKDSDYEKLFRMQIRFLSGEKHESRAYSLMGEIKRVTDWKNFTGSVEEAREELLNAYQRFVRSA
jgi:hypothetical protein